jgi:hypothetical protein
MKKLAILFLLSILLQSCYSYKTVENNASQYEIGKYYKVHQDKKRTVLSVKSVNDSTLVFGNRKFEEQSMSLESITKVEKRKFSIFKTLLIPVLYIALVVTVFVVLVTY